MHNALSPPPEPPDVAERPGASPQSLAQQAPQLPLPPRLLDLQAGLQQYLLDKAAQPPEALLGQVSTGPADRFAVQQRLHVYHHAYRARLVEALRDTFGHSAAYLDQQFDAAGGSAFERLALAYVAQHPSTRPSINVYGADLPGWLGEHLPQWPEVGELAQLDWQLRRAFDGPDATPLDLAGLAALAAQPGWAQQPLCPVPTAMPLVLCSNALALWHAIDQDQVPPPAERLPAPLTVLLWRQGHQPHFRSVGEVEQCALAVLWRQRSFSTLCEHLLQHFPDTDVVAQAGGLLRRWTDDGLLCADLAQAQTLAPPG